MTAQDRGWGPPCPASQIVNIQAGGRSFNVHRKVAPIFKAFIHELTTRTDYSIDKGTLDDWSYVCRKIAGSTSWSNHAWGLAIDVNSLTNPMKAPPMVTDMPAWVRDADYLLDKYGLKWGGTYQNRPDPMHYEFMLTPQDADRLAATVGTAIKEWYEMPMPDDVKADIRREVWVALNNPPPTDIVAKGGSVANRVAYLNPKLDEALANQETGLQNQQMFVTVIPDLTSGGGAVTDEQVAAIAGAIAAQLREAGLPDEVVAALVRELTD